MKNEKILIFGPSWVGDMVMAHSLFVNLKRRNPHCEIHLAAPNWSMDIGSRFPEIDKLIPLEFKHGKFDFFKRVTLGLRLRRESYDECIFLINTFKSLFNIAFANIPLRTGYVGELRSLFLNNSFKKNTEPTISKFSKLSIKKSYPSPKVINPKIASHKKNGENFLKKNRIPTKKLIIISGGAEYGPAKILPSEKYAYIANELIKKNYHILLIGSVNDITVNQKINKLTKNKCFDITGKTSLAECIDVISCAQYFLSNDSGLMHIAAALNVPQDSFFGSSDPKNTPPLNNKAIVNYLNLDCSPCFERQCPLKHFDCMNKIDEKEISKRIICLLNK